MSLTKKFAITIGFAAMLIAIGAVDAYVSHDVLMLPAISSEGEVDTRGIAKKKIDIEAILTELSFESEDTREQSLIKQAAPATAPVITRVLLRDDDRVAFFASVDSPEVKRYFLALKNILHPLFSSDLEGLRDEKIEEPGKPVMDILSFFDPTIHPERIFLIRTREYLFEFHIAPGKEDVVNELIETLTF